MTDLALDDAARTKILEDAIRPYLRDGWLIQSQSAHRAQLIRRGKKSKLLILILFLFLIVPGIFYLLLPVKEHIVLIEVNEQGKVKKTKVK